MITLFDYILFYFFAALAIASATVFIIRKGKKTDSLSLILKAVASICFIMLTCSGFNFGAGLFYSTLLVTGQIFGLLGDLFLDMKYLYRKDEKSYTFAGFIVFLIGHLFFTAFMIVTFGSNLLMILISIGVGILLALIIYFASEKIAGLVYGEYKLISSIYMFVLAFTMTFAILQIFLNNSGFFITTKVLLAVGLVFFMLSDLVLAMIYFTPDDKMNTPMFIRINLALYYIAQICISVSIAFLLY